MSNIQRHFQVRQDEVACGIEPGVEQFDALFLIKPVFEVLSKISQLLKVFKKRIQSFRYKLIS